MALKRIYVTSSPQRIANELSILEECRECRNVSKLLTAFRCRDQVVVVMPYVPNQDFRVRIVETLNSTVKGPTFTSLISSFQQDIFMTMSISSIQGYFRCMFRALCDLHALGIVHRDVKPANFLFNPVQNMGVLCDFGLAQVCCILVMFVYWPSWPKTHSNQQRIETETPANTCLHTPGTRSEPHGIHRSLEGMHRVRVSEKVGEARRRSTMSSDRVGIPADDTRCVTITTSHYSYKMY